MVIFYFNNKRYFFTFLNTLFIYFLPQRKGKENFPRKVDNKISTDSMEINSVNVQIGMYTNFISAEKDMPNILLLNIELLTGIENSSIKIRKNRFFHIDSKFLLFSIQNATQYVRF